MNPLSITSPRLNYYKYSCPLDPMRRRHDEREKKRIAKERIFILFEQARKRFLPDKSLSNRYVALAWRIAMKTRIHMPREMKIFYCKHCRAFLLPPHNVRIRIGRSHVARTCLECNRTMRFPYFKEQKKKRREKVLKQELNY